MAAKPGESIFAKGAGKPGKAKRPALFAVTTKKRKIDDSRSSAKQTQQTTSKIAAEGCDKGIAVASSSLTGLGGYGSSSSDSDD